MEFFMLGLNYFLLLIMLLISVAFITLMEQKILGSIQIRVGPNKVGYWGILQPFADAVKLFVKESSLPRESNYMVFFTMPLVSLFVVLILWMVLPLAYGGFFFELGLLYFVSISGLSVFPIMISGWSSNSKYSLLGGLRATAQMISYEVSLMTILLSLVWFSGSFNFLAMLSSSYLSWGLLVFLPLSMIWFASMLAETNRTPYDFSEGESELVSGFNTEYSAGGFTLVFMAEYASIIFMSFLFSLLFVSSGISVLYIMKGFIISFFFVWVRGTMPRFRYDKLMFLAWKSFLPISLCLLGYLLMFYWIFLGNL